MMSFPVVEGVPGVSNIVSRLVLGASTTKFTEFESVPSGFCRRMVRFPAMERSLAESDVVHCAADVQELVRAVPAIRIIEPGPGLDAINFAREISSVNPPADPEYALDGARVEIFGPPERVTVAVAD